MPLKKILFKPGVNRENTRYTTEGGWYECDKIRFRQGNPEKIGGWTRFNANTYLGICRSLWNWTSLGGANLVGVGTNLKFYVCQGGQYFDITPLDPGAPVVLNGPFAAVTTPPFSSTITVTDTAHGHITGDFVTFANVTSPGGLGGNITEAVLEQDYQITVIDANTYTFTAKDPTTGLPVLSNASDTGNGGATVQAYYQISIGPATQVPLLGWGAGGWGLGPWGTGTTSTSSLRIWNQYNYGEDLLYGPRGGGLYYWDYSAGTGTRGFNITTVGDASTPIYQNYFTVSDVSRFVIVFGTNDYGSVVLDPMLIRWSDQENYTVWTPAATNQAGSVTLSHGSEIVTAVQTRQEIVVFTDSAVYSLQYLGPPVVWGSQLLGDNISIVSPNAAVVASGAIYWMGVDKFYKYDGRVQTLNCNLRRYIFNDFNPNQNLQVFSGTNEGFNEVWWFYCSLDYDVVDKYVIYNYLEDTWYYGTLSRTAWLDSGLLDFPIAATYLNNIVQHEDGIDDNSTATPTPIESYISSSEFDIDDGHNFGFVWRVLPDLTFSNSTLSSTNQQPQVEMTLYALYNSGSGSIDNAGQNVVKGTTYVITEEFTGQIYTRVRGRQLIFKIGSTQLGTTWQLGAPRIDIRQDGRR
jgi:hypothetical protein